MIENAAAMVQSIAADINRSQFVGYILFYVL